jgi:ribosomal protein S18 acetylase RimI-like enzyme
MGRRAEKLAGKIGNGAAHRQGKEIAMQKNKLSDFDKAVHDDGLVIWYENESDEIVCLVSLKPQRNQTWICGLYVAQKYRGLGFCKALLDYATFNGGNHLSVRKSSRAAKIYENYGFATYDEDDDVLYMSINSRPEAEAGVRRAGF